MLESENIFHFIWTPPPLVMAMQEWQLEVHAFPLQAFEKRRRRRRRRRKVKAEGQGKEWALRKMDGPCWIPRHTNQTICDRACPMASSFTIRGNAVPKLDRRDEATAILC
jgi:hypothetical protein